MRPDRMIDLAHPDEIEIRRLSAASRPEAENIKAVLEARGFTVIIKERGGDNAPGPYQAEILAEKRVVPTEAELAARQASEARREKILRRDYRVLWIGVGIGALLILALLAYLLGPLVWAILKLG